MMCFVVQATMLAHAVEHNYHAGWSCVDTAMAMVAMAHVAMVAVVAVVAVVVMVDNTLAALLDKNPGWAGAPVMPGKSVDMPGACALQSVVDLPAIGVGMLAILAARLATGVGMLVILVARLAIGVDMLARLVILVDMLAILVARLVILVGMPARLVILVDMLARLAIGVDVLAIQHNRVVCQNCLACLVWLVWFFWFANLSKLSHVFVLLLWYDQNANHHSGHTDPSVRSCQCCCCCCCCCCR